MKAALKPGQGQFMNRSVNTLLRQLLQLDQWFEPFALAGSAQDSFPRSVLRFPVPHAGRRKL